MSFLFDERLQIETVKTVIDDDDDASVMFDYYCCASVCLFVDNITPNVMNKILWSCPG